MEGLGADTREGAGPPETGRLWPSASPSGNAPRGRRAWLLLLCPSMSPRAVTGTGGGGAQNGYCDTYTRSRMTELPLKLMTVFTVIISKSSSSSRGPLMGRVITRVALMGPVCRI